MTEYDIELCQGDSENIGFRLKEKGGTGTNLTGTTVTFAMVSDAGIDHEITCTEGGTVEGVLYTYGQGGGTIPFTSTHTDEADLFFGKFIVVQGAVQKTYPDGGDYISVKIFEQIIPEA